MIDKEALRAYAAAYDLILTEEMLTQFEQYAGLLLEWNQRVNLTAITEPDEILVKHFLDSILTAKAVPFPAAATLLDVGTGAGFPGIPLKIVDPSIRLVLLDSQNKRVQFLKEVGTALSQQNEYLHGRAEDVARDPSHRERYDLVTARALAALPALCEYCLPFVRVGGAFLALKGYEIEQELADADTAIRVLGGEVERVYKLSMPHSNRRAVVVVRKITQSPTKYPRKAIKITKNPI